MGFNVRTEAYRIREIAMIIMMSEPGFVGFMELAGL